MCVGTCVCVGTCEYLCTHMCMSQPLTRLLLNLKIGLCFCREESHTSIEGVSCPV